MVHIQKKKKVLKRTNCLCNFQTGNTVLITIVMSPLVYVTSSGLTKFGSLYLLTTFTHFAHPCLWQPPITSLYLSLIVFGRFPYTSELTLYFPFSDLFHLAKCPWGSSMLSQICFTLIKSKDNIKNRRIDVLTYV